MASKQKLQEVEEIISKISHVALDDIKGHERFPDYVDARHVIWVIAKDYLGFSLPQLAREYKRDHTTILYGIKKMRLNESYKSLLPKMKEKYPEIFARVCTTDGRPVDNWDV